MDDEYDDNPVGKPSADAADPVSVRRRGFIGMGIAGMVAAAWFALVAWVAGEGFRWSLPGAAVPLVPFLVFTTEAVTGRNIQSLDRAWDELAGWQRGVLGVVIVALAIVVIGGGVGLVLALTLP